MFHVCEFAEKSLNRLVLVRLIFTLFLITMYEIDTAAEVYLKRKMHMLLNIYN